MPSSSPAMQTAVQWHSQHPAVLRTNCRRSSHSTFCGSPDKLGRSRETGTDRKRCVITPFHKNRWLGFVKRYRSKRMPIFHQADKADLYI